MSDYQTPKTDKNLGLINPESSKDTNPHRKDPDIVKAAFEVRRYPPNNSKAIMTTLTSLLRNAPPCMRQVTQRCFSEHQIG
jgi:hypothetical protein